MNEKKHFDLDGIKTLHISKADQKRVAAPPLNMELVKMPVVHAWCLSC